MDDIVEQRERFVDPTSINDIDDGQVTSACFTMWDVTQNPEELFKDRITYIVYQVEVCPSTGRPHLQGFMQFEKKVRLGTLHKLCPMLYGIRIGDTDNYNVVLKGTEGAVYIEGTGCWITRMYDNSSPQACRAYCLKEDTRHPDYPPIELGKIRGVSAKLNPKRAQKEICEGTFDSDASPAHKWYAATHHSKIELIRKQRFLDYAMNLDFTKTRIFLFYGPPGTGKTHLAKYGIFNGSDFTGQYDDSPEKDTKYFWMNDFQSCGTPWLTDYKGQTRLFIDELEKTPMYRNKRVDVLIAACAQQFGHFAAKYGSMPRAWLDICITSNIEPQLLFGTDARYDPLKRRLVIIPCLTPLTEEIADASARPWTELARPALDLRQYIKK